MNYDYELNNALISAVADGESWNSTSYKYNLHLFVLKVAVLYAQAAGGTAVQQ